MKRFRRPPPQPTLADIVEDARREMAEAQTHQLFLECTACGIVAGQFDSTIARNDVMTHLLPKIAEEVLEAIGGLPWVDRAGDALPYQGHPRWGVITSPAAMTEGELLADLNDTIDTGTSSRPLRWTRGELIRLLEEARSLGYAQCDEGSWNWRFLCADCQYAKLRKPQGKRTKPHRDPVPPRLRFLIMQRDAFRCAYCGKSTQDGAVLHVDHVLSVADGGSNEEGNLVTACDECNLGKGREALP